MHLKWTVFLWIKMNLNELSNEMLYTMKISQSEL